MMRVRTPDQKGNGGERGIRTPDTVSRIHAFEARAFSHSAISPGRGFHSYFIREELQNRHECLFEKANFGDDAINRARSVVERGWKFVPIRTLTTWAAKIPAKRSTGKKEKTQSPDRDWLRRMGRAQCQQAAPKPLTSAPELLRHGPSQHGDRSFG
jgi:hypothetical protein